ncbi:MAG: hypothetical protein J1F36_00050 [Clostridiales bacterium]|nr:hypothetical protein [Clostridiales bacterium]
MKSRFFAAAIAIVIAVCALSSVACTKKEHQPEYVTLTLEQFKANAEEFTELTNYLSATGYKLDLEAQSTIDNIESSYNLSAILNLQDTTDVQLSVNFTSTNGGNIPGVMDGTLSLPQSLNVYMYDHTLYADVEIDYLISMTLKDSMPVDNDLTSILNTIINGDTNLPNVNVPTSDIEAMLDYFKDYLTITYCEELGHYILDLNYTGGTYDGEQIDPFTAKAELYVSSARITKVSLNFDSAEAKASGTLTESTEAIKRPSNPGSYEGGMLFDMLEGLLGGSSDIPSTDNPEVPSIDDILDMLPDGLLDSIISAILSGEQNSLQSLLEAYPELADLMKEYPELGAFLSNLFLGEEVLDDWTPEEVVDLTPEQRKMLEDYFDKLILTPELRQMLEEYFNSL